MRLVLVLPVTADYYKLVQITDYYVDITLKRIHLPTTYTNTNTNTNFVKTYLHILQAPTYGS